MNPKAEAIKKRAAEFARRAVALCGRLPDSPVGRRVSEQLTDSSTSISANYRAACRARSHAEFVSKIGQVEEEADESLGWLQFIVSSGLMTDQEIEWELKEAGRTHANLRRLTPNRERAAPAAIPPPLPLNAQSSATQSPIGNTIPNRQYNPQSAMQSPIGNAIRNRPIGNAISNPPISNSSSSTPA